LTHKEACDALRENTLAWTRGEITWAAWDHEVERILLARFPSETASRRAPDQEWIDLGHASRTSTTPGTRRHAGATPLAARRALATGQDAP
jgi:hypothetical protein